jgi:hypothetical protein
MIDLTNQKFGKLTVLEYSHTYNRRAMWKCICDCGNEKVISGRDLRTGKAKLVGNADM